MPSVDTAQNGLEEIDNEHEISNHYSESIFLKNTGVSSTNKTYVSQCVYTSQENCRTSVSFKKTFVPTHYITTLEVFEDREQFITSYEILPYFVQKTIPCNLQFTKDCATTNTKEYSYAVTLVHKPNFVEKRYLNKLELKPHGKTEVRIHLTDENTFTCEYPEKCNGNGTITNGTSKMATNGITDKSSKQNHDNYSKVSHTMTLINRENKTVREGEIWFSSFNCDKMFT